MPIYITELGLLGSQETPYSEYIGPNSPRIGIENFASKTTVSSSAGTLAANPAWLATLPSTDEKWVSESAPSHTFRYTSNIGEQAVDYIGFAAHSGLIGRQYIVSFLSSGGSSIESIGPIMITDLSPVFLTFDSVDCYGVEIIFSSIEAFDISIGHIGIGKSIALPRNIYVGHQPMPYSTSVSSRFATSDNGAFLGQEITKLLLSSSVSMSNVPPDYYRDIIYPEFSIPARSLPFYWKWRPRKYPKEVGFCWVPDGSVSVSNEKSNGFMQISFNMRGHVND